MFLNNAYNVINSGADYAYSLKNNNFINISKEKKLNMGKINISESELKSLIIKVIVRELKESIDTDRYEDVVFLQGEEADEALEILNNQGEDAAMDYLTQWHFPGEHMGSSELNHGSSDNTYERDGYIMSYNIPLNYIGLQYEFPGINESKHQDNKKRNKQKKFNKVMGEFGDGTLKTPNGDVVTDRKQALAIAYSESGLDESKQKLYNIVEGVVRKTLVEKYGSINENNIIQDKNISVNDFEVGDTLEVIGWTMLKDVEPGLYKIINVDNYPSITFVKKNGGKKKYRFPTFSITGKFGYIS